MHTLRTPSFRDFLIVDQLRCAGVLEAVGISRVGYPQRYDHRAFLERYRALRPSSSSRPRRGTRNDADACRLLVGTVKERIERTMEEQDGDNDNDNDNDNNNNNDPISVAIQIGETKVFLRRRAFNSLEILRDPSRSDPRSAYKCYPPACR